MYISRYPSFFPFSPVSPDVTFPTSLCLSTFPFHFIPSPSDLSRYPTLSSPCLFFYFLFCPVLPSTSVLYLNLYLSTLFFLLSLSSPFLLSLLPFPYSTFISIFLHVFSSSPFSPFHIAAQSLSFYIIFPPPPPSLHYLHFISSLVCHELYRFFAISCVFTRVQTQTRCWKFIRTSETFFHPHLLFSSPLRGKFRPSSGKVSLDKTSWDSGETRIPGIVCGGFCHTAMIGV
jgi:hypothetical protein